MVGGKRPGAGAPKRETPYAETACRTCNRPDVDEINAELVAGISVPAIGAKYGIRITNLRHHMNYHVLSDAYQQGAVLLPRVAEIKQIPLDMAERRDLIRAAISRLMEPLTTNRGLRGIYAVNWQALAVMLRLQQHDEQTMLRIVGVLRAEEGANPATGALAPQYQQMALQIEAKIAQLSDGDSVRARHIRQQLAEELAPMRDLIGDDPELAYLVWTEEDTAQ